MSHQLFTITLLEAIDHCAILRHTCTTKHKGQGKQPPCHNHAGPSLRPEAPAHIAAHDMAAMLLRPPVSVRVRNRSVPADAERHPMRPKTHSLRVPAAPRLLGRLLLAPLGEGLAEGAGCPAVTAARVLLPDARCTCKTGCGVLLAEPAATAAAGSLGALGVGRPATEAGLAPPVDTVQGGISNHWQIGGFKAASTQEFKQA